MTELNSAQRRQLRSLAHHLQPVCYVGKQGLTDALLASVNAALDDRELIKMKFNDHKEEKKAIAEEIAQKTGAHVAGIIGNIAILYRQQADEEKRKIELTD